jgi:hypothetical protein
MMVLMRTLFPVSYQNDAVTTACLFATVPIGSSRYSGSDHISDVRIRSDSSMLSKAGRSEGAACCGTVATATGAICWTAGARRTGADTTVIVSGDRGVGCCPHAGRASTQAASDNEDGLFMHVPERLMGFGREGRSD